MDDHQKDKSSDLQKKDFYEMMPPDIKLRHKMLHFEYLCSLLYKWYAQVYGDATKNDLGQLKTLMLLFFISAYSVRGKEDGAPHSDESMGLLSIFDNFVAMPFGPIEYDVYKNITMNTYYVIDKGCMEEKPGYSYKEEYKKFEAYVRERLSVSIPPEDVNKIIEQISEMSKLTWDLLTENTFQEKMRQEYQMTRSKER